MLDDDAKPKSPLWADDLSDFGVIVGRYQQPVFRFTYNLVGDRQQAEDIVQDVFVAAYRNRDSFDSERASFSTWLFTIARNRCINFLKRRKQRVVALDERTIETQPPVGDRAEFWDQLDRALAKLPLEQRTVFVLAEIEQLTYREIAEIESTHLGTVKSRLSRAKRALRLLLEPSMRETS